MTYFWPEGLPIEVEMDALGAPRRFRWYGESCQVEEIIDRWRLDEEWWRGQIWREYFLVATAQRQLAVLFHDLRTGTWRLERLYD